MKVKMIMLLFQILAISTLKSDSADIPEGYTSRECGCTREGHSVKHNCGGNMLLYPMQAMPLMETEIQFSTMEPAPTPRRGQPW
uniref:Secreted protein n=1 Tax=Anguilla anguilla TaxID=7936 RepID=A0A0E9RXH6_ANGAN